MLTLFPPPPATWRVGSGFFHYHLKIVPTTYEARMGRRILTNQYSFTEIFRSTATVDHVPAVHINYELSPIMARFTRTHQTLGEFLTGLCAIIGGVFTLAGAVDAVLYRLGAGRDSFGLARDHAAAT